MIDILPISSPLQSLSSIITSSSSQHAGYIAAFTSCIAFGSFAVPLKSMKKIDVDPLVFQSYKTTMCLLTSLALLTFVPSLQLSFTPWGIVSGIFWVPAGVAHIFGIRVAGLAIAQGTSSSIIVMVSFSWGVIAFHESVYSVHVALFAVLLMVLGICGMSYFSASASAAGGAGTSASDINNSSEKIASSSCMMMMTLLKMPKKSSKTKKLKLHNNKKDGGRKDDDEEEEEEIEAVVELVDMMTTTTKTKTNPSKMIMSTLPEDEPLLTMTSNDTTILNSCNGNNEEEVLMMTTQTSMKRKHVAAAAIVNNDVENSSKSSSNVVVKEKQQQQHGSIIISSNDDETSSPSTRGGSGSGAKLMLMSLSAHLKRNYDIHLSPPQLGLICSALGGIWGGSVMVPLHFAGSQTKGLNYLFSFAIGSSLINILLWLIRYFYHVHRTNYNYWIAYCSLPSFHFRQMLCPGSTSGILWSIGNMASIISVSNLGEGVGYSLTQSAMLISGLWGICYFHEIVSTKRILGWFGSAFIALAGIVLLSSQHVPMAKPVVHK